jgi:hypothetical protein
MIAAVYGPNFDPDDQNIIAARVKIMDNIKGYKNKMLKQLEVSTPLNWLRYDTNCAKSDPCQVPDGSSFYCQKKQY